MKYVDFVGCFPSELYLHYPPLLLRHMILRMVLDMENVNDERMRFGYMTNSINHRNKAISYLTKMASCDTRAIKEEARAFITRNFNNGLDYDGVYHRASSQNAEDALFFTYEEIIPRMAVPSLSRYPSFISTYSVYQNRTFAFEIAPWVFQWRYYLKFLKTVWSICGDRAAGMLIDGTCPIHFDAEESKSYVKEIEAEMKREVYAGNIPWFVGKPPIHVDVKTKLKHLDIAKRNS